MKNKAYTVRFNYEVEAERKLLDMLESDSKSSYRSTSECIKSRLSEYYDNNKKSDRFEELIKESQKELLEQMYDICLKIISAVGGKAINSIATADVKESVLPESTDEFPDALSEILNIFVS